MIVRQVVLFKSEYGFYLGQRRSLRKIQYCEMSAQRIEYVHIHQQSR